MSAHDADVTLRQIVEVCDKAIELRNTTTWEEFHKDWRKQTLGERLVEVLGEAVKRLPDDLRPAVSTIAVAKRLPARGITLLTVYPRSGKPGPSPQ